MVTRDWREERLGNQCLMGIEFQCGMIKSFGDSINSIKNVSILYAIELHN